ncbi:hypothetical protein scyTo_0014489 [Scyliorhinus torazame]|uniref:Charged multivesicular body protein 7 n=1 Tax=Scyliorhinus torazame TaxID=75743 RepID=A0A401NND3_SCYTO|nr:hypothetical protein [Scyliorhinus torazame]
MAAAGAGEPPGEPCPDWADEQRMAFLFSAFKRSREVNSSDWDAKLAFWAPLVLREAARRGRLAFRPRELGAWFRRKGAAPLGLGTIVKFSHSPAKEVSAVTEVDVGVYQLVKCEKTLTQKIEALAQEGERCMEDARSHLRAGKKNLVSNGALG